MVLFPKKAKGTGVACFVHASQIEQNFILAHLVTATVAFLTL